MYKEITSALGYSIDESGQVIKTNTGKPIEEMTNNLNGYRCYRLRTKLFYTHELVAEYFVPNPEGYKKIIHWDNDIKNNHYENLEWTNENIGWKILNEAPNYSINELGQVKNNITCRILKTHHTNTAGYNFHNKHYRACDLVAKYFVPNPLNLTDVRHKDNDKFNNHYENIEWYESLEIKEKRIEWKIKEKRIEWKIIDEDPNYSINEFGTVKKNINGKVKKHTNGYYHFVYKTYKVCNLVAKYFVPNPLNLTDVRHIDDEKSNNNFSNLEWCFKEKISKQNV